MSKKRGYAEIQAEIAQLQAEADKLKSEEKRGVIGRIKEAIKEYGITPRELFGNTATATSSKSPLSASPKYSDGNGNTWVGRGPRPEWLRDALAAGKKLEDFAVAGARPNGAMKVTTPARKASAKKAGATKAPSKKAGKQTKNAGSPKFKDDAGNMWSGRGPQPNWLKAALAGGKKLEELRA